MYFEILLNVRLLWYLILVFVLEILCCLIAFGTRDRVGGNYRCDFLGYLQDIERMERDKVDICGYDYLYFRYLFIDLRYWLY